MIDDYDASAIRWKKPNHAINPSIHHSADTFARAPGKDRIRMDVKPGYKQTEVGTIPEDWEAVPIGRLLTFKNGLNKAKQYFGSGTPIVNYMDVYQNPGLLAENISGKVHVTSVEQRNYSAELGDVFFTRTSETVEEIGMSAVLLDDVDGAVFSGFLLRGRPISNALQLEYRKYCFGQELVRQQIISTSSYTTRALTNGRLLSRVVVPLPPTLAEQQAIAEALSDVDALISALDRLIAKKRAIKQGAMQELLTGRRRLPGFGGEWKFTRLDEVCFMKSGESITGAEIDDHAPYPCYGGNGLRGYTIRYTHDGSYALIGRQGALCGNVLGIEGKFFASEHAIVVTPLLDTDIHWLTFMLGEMDLNRYSESSAQPGLSVSKLENLQLGCPPTLAEQTAIAIILSDMDAEIAALERRRDKTKLLKQGMMQELLTGRTRLV